MSGGSTMCRFARGGAVTALGQVVTIAVSLTSIVVLSRLLPPEDFGLIAMVGVVTSLGNILRDMGLSVAALRATNLSNQQASNLFWINTLLSGGVAALAALSGPLLSSIYSEPKLVAITPVLALAMFFGGTQAQFQVQLARSHKFGRLAAISGSTAVLGLVVAVAAAYAGLGYWALVLQVVVASGVELLLKIFAAQWTPSRPRRRASTKGLAVSGADIAASNIVTYFASNAATFMIGVRMGAADVGLYSRAMSLISLPATVFGPLVNVALPVLQEARVQGEDPNPQLLRMQSLLATGAAFILVLVSAAAPELFLVVLGPQWGEAAILFRILAIAGVVDGLTQVNLWGFLVHGKTRALLQYNLVSKPLTAVLVIMGALVSLPATAVGYSLARLTSWLIGVWWLDRSAKVNGRSFYWNGVRIMIAAAVAVVTSLLLSTQLPQNLLGGIVVPFVVSGSMFLLLIASTPNGRNDLRIVWRSGLRALSA